MFVRLGCIAVFAIALTASAAGTTMGGGAASAGDGATATTAAAAAAVRSATAPRGAAPCRARGRGLFARPDPRCTPGATDPRVTQANLATTVCHRGWTRAVRPDESVTEPQKRAAMVAYGDAGSPRRYEYDHLIPLELGGAPDDLRNLWPEPGAAPNPKDRLERALNRAVCTGRLLLATARRTIASDWVAAYRVRFG